MPKTVWVLGAGFPRSVGGPLLADLFRQERIEDLLAYFPRDTFPHIALEVLAAQVAFNWGKDVDHLWSDAEQFLAFVDDAYEGPAPEKRRRLDLLARVAQPYDPVRKNHYGVTGIASFLAADLRRVARRALAAETTRFMMSDHSGELWLPYREWLATLQPSSDTILTFNYDLLLEELDDKSRLSVPLPSDDIDRTKVPLLKLHGSVDWIRSDDAYMRVPPTTTLADPSGAVPAIAAPGRSKAPDGLPPFPNLWGKAERALWDAQWVVFIGYRFPPTDAVAKMRLLEALRRGGPGSFRRFDTASDRAFSPTIPAVC